MEIICYLLLILSTALSVALLLQNRRLKKDIYQFSDQLNLCLLALLNGSKLPPALPLTDDLWGMVYDKLRRISALYDHKSQELLQEQENLKRLVSDFSHQMKTPLSNIHLYLELLTEEATANTADNHLPKLQGQVEKLTFLLQSMVKMSQLETGAIKIQPAEHPIGQTLAAAIEAVILKADQKRITLHVAYDEALYLRHDKKWTAEAIFNLLDNAVKYTDCGGSIHILVQRETVFTRISVTDNGKGIAFERQGAIFTRFYREPELYDSEGAGIGLHLARKIITMQAGYIEVKSDVGTGSTFSIYLPN